MLRRFERDRILESTAVLSAEWEVSATDETGNLSIATPWNLAGVAIFAIAAGSQQGDRPTRLDILQLCYAFANSQHPVNNQETADDGLGVVSRLMYQQWPFQKLGGNHWARTRALFVDTAFSSRYVPEVMKPGWATELLNGSIDEFVATGFMLMAGAKTSGGLYPTTWTDLDGLLEIFPRERFDAVASSNFVGTMSHLKERWLDTRVLGQEAFSFNPLIERPFVADIMTGRSLAPNLQLIAQRASALGVVYAGLSRWGEAFTRDLGDLFEQYVGHIARSRNTEVVEAFEYGPRKHRLDTVDWFMTLESSILLIEVKSAIPTQDIRLGAQGFANTMTRKLSKAMDQINRTVLAQQSGAAGFSRMPVDRKLVGMVVTLGPFHLANHPLVRLKLTEPSIPTSVVSIEDFEHLMGRPPQQVDSLINEALQSRATTSSFDIQPAVSRLPNSINPVLARSWDGSPMMHWMARRRADLRWAGPDD